ncbi:phage tail sheath C-terminal domain-containing protein [Moritella viscosa]
MYRVNAFGDVDPSYLDITTTATLGYLRYSLKSMVTSSFPRHKLASDDVLANIDPSQPIVTPKLMRQAILALALEWVNNGLIEGYEQFADSLQVSRDSGDVNRLNVLMHPDCVNQLRILAALIQYKL